MVIELREGSLGVMEASWSASSLPGIPEWLLTLTHLIWMFLMEIISKIVFAMDKGSNFIEGIGSCWVGCVSSSDGAFLIPVGDNLSLVMYLGGWFSSKFSWEDDIVLF